MKLYSTLAEWWPLVSAPSDYEEESGIFAGHLLAAGNHPARTLVDVAEGMLAVSRELNPDCEHVQGDMRTVWLGRQFDRVFIHDAICYMTTLEDLKQAVETAFVHCRPGGARYLEWTHDPDPADTEYTVDYVFALRAEDGSIRVEHDRSVEGLFSREDWLRVLGDAGFEAMVAPFEHSEVEPGSVEMFVAVRPGP